ncbi:MAG TPA: hypothetical protein VHF92_05520 [Geodermatophilus sp.]|nr:hypothetical protein [Geodermatophilus sp.]
MYPLASPTAPLAHEAWFVPDPHRFPLQWDLLTSRATVQAIAVAVATVAVFALVQARWGEPRLKALDPLVRLRPYLAEILSVGIGLALIGTALIDGYLAPSMRLPDNQFGRLLGAVEVAIAVLLIVGWRRRVVAALLVAAGPLGMLAYGVQPVLERADLLGAAAYLALAHGREVDPTRRAIVNPTANLVMRVLAAIAIGVLAFTEKLLNPAMAQAFLDLHPKFDIFRLLGLGGAADFIGFAATMELTLAALLLAGRLPRLTVVLVGIPFVMTAPLLGVTELVGHLPLYAILLVVLVEAQVQRLPVEHEEYGDRVEPLVPTLVKAALAAEPAGVAPEQPEPAPVPEQRAPARVPAERSQSAALHEPAERSRPAALPPPAERSRPAAPPEPVGRTSRWWFLTACVATVVGHLVRRRHSTRAQPT